jgi:hypothetical protein
VGVAGITFILYTRRKLSGFEIDLRLREHTFIDQTPLHGSEPSILVALPNKPQEAHAAPNALRLRLWPHRTGHRPQSQDLFLGGAALKTNLQKVR